MTHMIKVDVQSIAAANRIARRAELAAARKARNARAGGYHSGDHSDRQSALQAYRTHLGKMGRVYTLARAYCNGTPYRCAEPETPRNPITLHIRGMVVDLLDREGVPEFRNASRDQQVARIATWLGTP